VPSTPTRATRPKPLSQLRSWECPHWWWGTGPRPTARRWRLPRPPRSRLGAYRHRRSQAAAGLRWSLPSLISFSPRGGTRCTKCAAPV
jgi:hypothetical protein